MKIRPAVSDDVESILEIYAPIVENSAASFEYVVPSSGQIVERINQSHLWLVAVDANEKVAGYAYGAPHRLRAAYQWSVETSAYVHPKFHRQGVGQALYSDLFRKLTEKGFYSAFAGITLPNEASTKFHESLGFNKIGVFKNIGRKFDRWHDVAWFQRPLAE